MTGEVSHLHGIVQLDVSGMKCGGCAASVDTLLQKQPGVIQVTIDFPAKHARLVVDDKSFDEPKTLEVLTAAGYPSQITK